MGNAGSAIAGPAQGSGKRGIRFHAWPWGSNPAPGVSGFAYPTWKRLPRDPT